MRENAPGIEEWRELYESIIRVKEIAPWEWMTEDVIFGVQNPETEELGFLSVMGMLGEHYAVSLYPSPEALYDFWGLEEMGDMVDPEALLQIPQIQASLEDRNELHNKDRQTIKELGLKFRGRKEWPMFRSYRPGFAPWFVEAEEARFLTYALNQLVDVAQRFREDASLLEPPGEESYLVRVPRREDGALLWEDRVMEVPPPEPSPIPIEIDAPVVENLERLPHGELEVEMDFFMLPAPVKEGGDRPVFPYMLMTVDTDSAMILGHEILTVDSSLEAMWGSIPQNAAQQFVSVGAIPAKVTVGSELLFALLHSLAEVVDFEIEHSHLLPILHPLKEHLFHSIE